MSFGPQVPELQAQQLVSTWVLKLVLAPALVASAGLLGRRFGQHLAGWLIGFPFVAGPILWLYAREQGSGFASRAALGTALGTVSLCAFLFAYAKLAERLHWLACLLMGWLAFTSVSLLLSQVPALLELPWPFLVLIPWLALALVVRVLPRVPEHQRGARPKHDLLLRVGATMLLVLTLTSLAGVLGPSLSGLFTPFPVATTILVVFAHREEGLPGVLAVYSGFLPGLYGFVSFCVAVSVALTVWSPMLAFAFALAVCALLQTGVLLWLQPKRARV